MCGLREITLEALHCVNKDVDTTASRVPPHSVPEISVHQVKASDSDTIGNKRLKFITDVY